MESAFPDKTIEFRSMQQMIKENYNSVRVFSNATMLAAITMFFVMLMGLIGYTTDEVRRRSKEIAIRKVNGSEQPEFWTAGEGCALCSCCCSFNRSGSSMVRQWYVDGFVCRTCSAQLGCLSSDSNCKSGSLVACVTLEIMEDCQ